MIKQFYVLLRFIIYGYFFILHMSFRLLLFPVVLFLIKFHVYPAGDSLRVTSSGQHELSIYVIPSMYPLDWESPASLYKSVKKCYAKTIYYKTNYLMGHTIVEVNSPTLEKPVYIAQMSRSMKEKRDMIFKEKVGYAIIGAVLQGKIESEEEIQHAFKVYSKRNKLAFIKYSISDDAFERVMAFINHYSGKENPDYTPYINYGGAFWPRYKEEGSGCSAFGMTVLELVNLLPEAHTQAWQLNNKIPIELIGGRYNQGHKVKTSDIKKADQWYQGKGRINVDYVLYSVYNPSIIFDWIKDNRQANSPDYVPIEHNGVPGLYVDATKTQFDRQEPLFLDRKQPNLFIEVHKKSGVNRVAYVLK